MTSQTVTPHSIAAVIVVEPYMPTASLCCMMLRSYKHNGGLSPNYENEISFKVPGLICQ
jgi:hypothetical protein